TVPATIIRSAWRGVARKAPAPKRSMSKRDAPVAIISMAQQARPKVIGHMLDSRAQLIACSSVVVMAFSSLPNPSNQPISQLLCIPEPLAPPPPRSGEGEQKPSPPLRFGEGAGGGVEQIVKNLFRPRPAAAAPP